MTAYSGSRSNVSMWIERHGENPVEPSETITGKVHVETRENVQCHGLILRLEWHTHGRGNPTEQCIESLSFNEGMWTAGEHYSYDFELSLPPGPYTYHGKYLNVSWRLQAIAHTDSSGKLKAVTGVLLEPSGTERRFRAGNEDVADTALAADDDQTISWSGVLQGLPYMIPGLLFIGGGLHFLTTASLNASDAPIALNIIFILIFPAAASLYFFYVGSRKLYSSIQNVFAEIRLGNVDVHLSSPDATPGERIRCRVSMETSGTVDLNEITVRLHCYEKVVETDMSKDDHVYTHTVHDETTSIQSSQQATLRGGKRTFKTDIELPDSAPFSFHAEDNELKWDMEVHVDVPNWPDWMHVEPLTVQPPTG